MLFTLKPKPKLKQNVEIELESDTKILHLNPKTKI